MSFSIQDFFHLKKPNLKALQEYGFQPKEGGYTWVTSIVDNSFILRVNVSNLGQVQIEVQDAETKDPYTLYATKASGEYVKSVRMALEEILQEIANTCFVSNVFQSPQSQAVIEYIENQYQATLEFLWEKYPDVAIWRHSDNNKWFGLIARLPLSKLGLDVQEEGEILVLHWPKELIQQEVQAQEKDAYPAWHMNKTHWYSVILNDGLSNQEVFQRIDESFHATQK